MRMMSLSLSGRERWELALKLLVGVVVPTHLQHLVNPRDKVIAPVQSKLTNPMITMMITSIPPRPTTQMGIVKMVYYTRGSHNVYKERYSDPAL
jgi:hypothetical protein